MGVFDDLPDELTPGSIKKRPSKSAFDELPDEASPSPAFVDDVGVAEEKPTSAFAEFGISEPSLLERGKRFVSDIFAHDTARTPAPVRSSPAPAPLPAGPIPAPEPQAPTGPLSKAMGVLVRTVSRPGESPAVAGREIAFPVYDYPAESMTQVGEMAAAIPRAAVEGFTFLPRMAAAGAGGLILLGQGKSKEEAAAAIEEAMAGTSTEAIVPMSETEKQILEVLSSPFKTPEAAVDAVVKKFPGLADYPATLTAVQSIAEAALYIAPFRTAIREGIEPSRLHKKTGEAIASWSKEDVRSILRATDEATIDPQLLDAFKKLPSEAKAKAIKESGIRIEQLDPSVLGRVLGVKEAKNVIRLGTEEVAGGAKASGPAGVLAEKAGEESVRPEAPKRESAFSDLPDVSSETNVLRPAVISGGEEYVGAVGATHADILDAHGLDADTAGRGYVDQSGKYMTRVEARQWLEKNDPESAMKLREATGIEPSAPAKEQEQPPPSPPTRLFTKQPDFKAIVDEYYGRFPTAADQPRSLVEWGAKETWKRSRWPSAGSDVPDQTLFERMNTRIAAKMKETPAPAPATPAMQAAGELPGSPQSEGGPKAPAATDESPATERDEGILRSEEGFLDTSFLTPGIDAGRDVKAGVSSLILPTAKSREHLRAAEVLGSKLGSSHRDAEIASKSLGKESRVFDKMGVHDPKLPLADNPGVKFMSNRERKTLSPETQKIGDKVENLFADRLGKLEQAGVELRTVRENYFPGMWTNDSIKAFNQAVAEVVAPMEGKLPESHEDWTAEQKAVVKARVQEILAKGGKGSDKSALSYLSRKQLKGKESFRKHKVFDDIMDGIDLGLVPISNNPIDLVKLKLAEMDRSIMANRALREWEKAGDVKFLRIGQEMPEGFARINDKYGTVYGPPVQTVTEHVDKTVYDGLMKVAKDLGISPERKFSAGRAKLGYAAPGGETVTQFATELSVLAHEIGHQLDFKYGLWDKIVAGATDTGKRGVVTEAASAKKRAKIQDELRALADLTWEGSEASKYYKQKVRKRAEKMAHMLEAYIHAPERFKEVAPTVYADFDAFIKAHDELKGLSEIKQGLALEKISVEKPVGGYPVIGHRIAKAPIADILNNFLSSSIYNSPYFGTAFKAYMGTANLLNQTQLGVGSAFHAGFTSADVQISHNAEVVKDVYGVIRGNRKLGDLARTIKKVPAAMISNPRRGAKVVREWRTPTLDVSTTVPVGQLPKTNEARVAMIAKAMELAGGASRLERGLRTEWTEKQIREWYGNQKIRAAARTPVVLVELMAKPIMEWLVPRQKAGVFGELAGRIIEANPGKTMEELTPQFRQAWNRVDARLGQVVYDRLFINNMAKNVIQGAIRAPGWTGGTIAEIGGAPKDLINFFAEWKRTGKAPQDIPDRVAYVIALFATVMSANYLLTKAFTGEDPEGMDYWAFRTGGLDEKGRAERFLLPTYMKDLFAWWQNWGHTLLAKTHPLLGVIGDIWRNRDFYGIKIRNEDDPVIQQAADTVGYGLKQFEPFWIRGAAREAERGGGLEKTLQEEPQKILAPQLGIMPATSAYTMSAFEKYARKVAEERHPLGARTKEQAEKSKLKQKLEMGLRRWDPEAMADLEMARAAGEITRTEAIEIKHRAKQDPIEKIAKSMTLEDLVKGIRLATEQEKEIIRPIFRKKLINKSSELDRETRQQYKEILRDL